ncbi:MAG: quinone oxidoreductase family protein [Pseudoclavibacter sp.]
MKAAVLREIGGPDAVHVENIDVPSAEDEVLIRIRAAGLNRRDLFITYGQYPRIELPFVVGSDGAGEIVRLPSGAASDLRVGDDVMILPSFDWGDDPRVQAPNFTTLGMPRDGTFAEYVSVPAEYVFRMPPHLSHAEAAAFPLAGLTAYRALTTRGGVRPGETVLVPGAGGGVASFTVLFAKALGANVVVTSRRDDNLELARSLGADAGINTTSEGWTKQLKAEVGTVDLVIDTIGGPMLPDLVRAVRPGGRIVSLGASAGPVPELVMPMLFLKQVDVLGTSMGTAAEFERMLDLIRESNLRPLVGSRFALDNVGEAMKAMESGAPAGKIILEQ